MERDDLRWLCEDGCDDPNHFDPVTDADLASLGLVQRPVCDKCRGSGFIGCDDPPIRERPCREGKHPCPSCDGTGFVRLVALDGIDVEALRRYAETYRECKATGYRYGYDDGPEELWALADQLVAAIDQEV